MPEVAAMTAPTISHHTHDPLLTVAEAAEMMGVDPETVRRWTRKGAIECVEVGPFRLKRIRLSVVRDNVRESQADA